MQIEPPDSSDNRLLGLILAAGSGSRYGALKQLLPVNELPMVVRAVRLAAAVCDAGVLVVTGAGQADIVSALAGESARAVYNPAWREGMGASLRQGAQAAPAGLSGLLVMLADQAALSAADIQNLLNAWLAQPEQPAAAWFGGRLGAPAIFPASWLPRLLAAQGDQGARSLLRAGIDVSRVPMASAGEDIDTPADYLRLAGREE
jgi:CTP:molybdopterin cytidylyltransferase MocA